MTIACPLGLLIQKQLRACQLYLNVSHQGALQFHAQILSVFSMDALARLILSANSSQAKGRVGRVNRTLQDRLVKELRLAGIPEFMKSFNERFAIAPADSRDLHRPLQIAPSRLSDILCRREQRYVGAQLTFHYDRKHIIAAPSKSSCETTAQPRFQLRYR
jgi:hypothetical protein